MSRCSGSNGLMDDNCVCTWDTDCDSGRCELIETGTCEAQLAVGARCNEDSDCKSNFCSWRFQCDELRPEGDFCWGNSDCQSGICNWRFHCAAGEDDSSSTSSVAMAESMAIPTGRASSGTFDRLFAGKALLAAMCVAVIGKYVIPFYRRYQSGYEELPGMELTV